MVTPKCQVSDDKSLDAQNLDHCVISFSSRTSCVKNRTSITLKKEEKRTKCKLFTNKNRWRLSDWRFGNAFVFIHAENIKWLVRFDGIHWQQIKEKMNEQTYRRARDDKFTAFLDIRALYTREWYANCRSYLSSWISIFNSCENSIRTK